MSLYSPDTDPWKAQRYRDDSEWNDLKHMLESRQQKTDP